MQDFVWGYCETILKKWSYGTEELSCGIEKKNLTELQKNIAELKNKYFTGLKKKVFRNWKYICRIEK